VRAGAVGVAIPGPGAGFWLPTIQIALGALLHVGLAAFSFCPSVSGRRSAIAAVAWSSNVHLIEVELNELNVLSMKFASEIYGTALRKSLFFSPD
jgi:hypothetical protein